MGLSIAAGLVALRANLACAGANEIMAKQKTRFNQPGQRGGVRALDSLIVAQVGGEAGGPGKQPFIFRLSGFRCVAAA